MRLLKYLWLALALLALPAHADQLTKYQPTPLEAQLHREFHEDFRQFAQIPGNLAAPLFVRAVAGPYTANAVDYNGSGDYLASVSLSGAPTTGKVSASVWFRLDGSNGSTLRLVDFINTTAGLDVFGIARLSSNLLRVTAESVSANLFFGTSATFTSGATWHNILLSYDISQAIGSRAPLLYIDNVSDETTVSDSGAGLASVWSAIDDAEVAARVGANTFDGCLAELWISPGTQIDFTSSANRALFISGGKPVNLGTTGQIPTGASPLVYLKNVAASAGTNSGTGGNFTITGAPAACSTSPSTLLLERLPHYANDNIHLLRRAG